MLKTQFILPLLLILALGFSPHGLAQQNYSKMVAFGDSLSDTGNLSAITISLPSIYFENRISNGPVALDYLAAGIGSNADSSLHLLGQTGGFNFSVAGGNILGSDIEDLSAQVGAYIVRTGGIADSQALHVVFMGGNDLRDIRGLSDSAMAEAKIDLVIAQLILQLKRLKMAGAISFFVPNIPNLGLLPETLEGEPNDPGITARATSYTLNYNQKLSTALNNFESGSSLNLIRFDTYAVVGNLIANAASLGFTNTTEGCLDTSDLPFPRFHEDCVSGPFFDPQIDFTGFVFFDNLHPAGATHQIIGEQMVTALVARPNETINLSPLLFLLLDE